MSDAFVHKVENPEIELTCRVYNINHGRNQKLLEDCPFLKEYMIFVDYVREFHAKQDFENLEMAINLAIDRCIMENVLKDFLKEHRSEVVKVTQLDYTFDRQIELERIDARREGLQEGIEQGIEQGVELIAKKMLVANKPVEEIMQFTGLSKERLNQLADYLV